MTGKICLIETLVEAIPIKRFEKNLILDRNLPFFFRRAIRTSVCDFYEVF